MILTLPAYAHGLVHARLDRQPGISGFGTLLHLARLNHFTGRDFPAAFGFGFQYREDLSQILAFSKARQARLAHVVTGAQGIPEMWLAHAWQPFEGNVWQWLRWRLRICPSCARSGYHTNLFQMPWIERCPWHDVPLLEQCRRCGTSWAEGFKHTGILLQCQCGLDYVKEKSVLGNALVQEEQRQALVDAYLRWAQAQRSKAALIGPEESDPGAKLAIAALVAAPASLHPWASMWHRSSCDIHCRQLRRQPASQPPERTVRKAVTQYAQSFWPGLPGMAQLPHTLWPILMGVTRELAAGLPDTGLTSREREAWSLAPKKHAAVSSSRMELLLLPLQPVVDGLYLDVRVLPRSAYRTLSQLAHRLIDNDPAYAHGASGSHALLATAMSKVLAPAYAAGFTLVAGRYLPALYDHYRLRTGYRSPWLIVDHDVQGALSVKIAWSKRRSWTSIELADQEQQKARRTHDTKKSRTRPKRLRG
ncbi:hypothetical protein [Xanthomonas axonopodis]